MTIATLSTSVQQCINNFAAALTRNKTLILQCIGFTFLWGLIAHGYMFANNNLTHDAIGQFQEVFGAYEWKVLLGRIFVPIYEVLTRGLVTIPWLLGILSLFYISIATFFIVKTFDIKSQYLTFVISGILTVNVTTIELVAYVLSDFDADMFAMLLSIFAVYCLVKYKYGYLYSILPIVISLGLYQSYISTTLTLIIAYCLIKTISSHSMREIYFFILKAIVMILVSGFIYYCALKLYCITFDSSLASGDTNALDNNFLHTPFIHQINACITAYKDSIILCLMPPSIYQNKVIFIIHTLIVVLTLICVVYYLIQKKAKTINIVFLGIYLLILPICMNTARFLTNGYSYALMHFAMWLVNYLIPLLIVHSMNYKSNSVLKYIKYILHTIIIIILLGNVRYANTAYITKDMDRHGLDLYFNRVIYEMEHFEGYKTGETPIAFIGKPNHIFRNALRYDRVQKICRFSTTYPAKVFYGSYFYHAMSNPAKIIDPESINVLESNKIVLSMPAYPSKGCMVFIGDTLVVKLGEVEVQP